MGMTTGKFGPGRQIYDKSYYMLTLRTKLQDLTQEITKFRAEIDQIQNDNNQYSRYEKRYDELIKSVRNLEGDLADYNLALDKNRTDTRPEEVQHMYFLLKQQNDQQRQDLDSIFLEKKHHEKQAVLKAEADTLKLSIPEQRELLLAKVKKENLDIVAAEKSFDKVKKENLDI